MNESSIKISRKGSVVNSTARGRVEVIKPGERRASLIPGIGTLKEIGAGILDVLHGDEDSDSDDEGDEEVSEREVHAATKVSRPN